MRRGKVKRGERLSMREKGEKGEKGEEIPVLKCLSVLHGSNRCAHSHPSSCPYLRKGKKKKKRRKRQV